MSCSLRENGDSAGCHEKKGVRSQRSSKTGSTSRLNRRHLPSIEYPAYRSVYIGGAHSLLETTNLMHMRSVVGDDAMRWLGQRRADRQFCQACILVRRVHPSSYWICAGLTVAHGTADQEEPALLASQCGNPSFQVGRRFVIVVDIVASGCLNAGN